MSNEKRLIQTSQGPLYLMPSIPNGNYRILRVVERTLIAIYENGFIWNISNGQPVLKSNDKDGYEVTKFGKVHRLMGYAFLGVPENKYLQIRHLDGNPSNNNISNLKWGSAQENWEDRKLHHGPNGGNVGFSHSEETKLKISQTKLSKGNNNVQNTSA